MGATTGYPSLAVPALEEIFMRWQPEQDFIRALRDSCLKWGFWLWSFEIPADHWAGVSFRHATRQQPLHERFFSSHSTSKDTFILIELYAPSDNITWFA